MKQSINIVWLKRDLRFTDHEPLFIAQKQTLPLLIVYFFEPSLLNYPDSDVRHWRFVYESILEMQQKLQPLQAQIYVFYAEVVPVFQTLTQHYHYHIQNIYSHQEIGNKCSYDRDIEMQKFCKNNQIVWHEFQTNGIVRKLKSRKNWEELWKLKMTEPPKMVAEEKWNFLPLPHSIYKSIKGPDLPTEITVRNKNFQQGGEYWAWRYLQSFLKERHANYSFHISKPELSRRGCSRLSPYLAYGNISMRMVYQFTMQHYEKSPHKRALSNFVSRLHWHCHFIQKFEDECRMEFENVNKAYDDLQKPKNESFILAWQTGQTGIPIVDACMRCVVATGFLNFRMRAMVVSFFTFNLWQDWQELHFLARQFLDYEPGIHYPQLQMQSGTTGINTIRIYNPIKNSQEHDAEGVFIKKWLPELANVPIAFVHEPWIMSNLEQQLYGCEIGKTYPLPIVDVEETRKKASDIVWSFRKNDAVKIEGKRILQKHVSNPNNNKKSKNITENNQTKLTI